MTFGVLGSPGASLSMKIGEVSQEVNLEGYSNAPRIPPSPTWRLGGLEDWRIGGEKWLVGLEI